MLDFKEFSLLDVTCKSLQLYKEGRHWTWNVHNCCNLISRCFVKGSVWLISKTAHVHSNMEMTVNQKLNATLQQLVLSLINDNRLLRWVLEMLPTGMYEDVNNAGSSCYPCNILYFSMLYWPIWYCTFQCSIDQFDTQYICIMYTSHCIL